jgi:hypothetical protein
MKAFLVILVLLTDAHGWIERRPHLSQSRQFTQTTELALSDEMQEIPTSAELETDHPCWGKMLDDDCSMGDIYAANFVASKWIRSMPCGQGIEVRVFLCLLFGSSRILLGDSNL